jgi:hypothetical protein
MRVSDDEYYVRHDGTTDDLAALLNCFQAGLYFALKRKRRLDFPLYELFAADPAIAAEIDRDGTFRDIRTLRNWTCFDVFRTIDVEGWGAKALAGMEALLDQGEIVLFTTHNARIPFFEGYDSPEAHYDPVVHITPQNHMFTAVGHDADHLYYVESPHLLTPHHVQFGDFAGVGVIRKEVMAPAFDCFLNYRHAVIQDQVVTPEFLQRRFKGVLDTVMSAEGKGFSSTELCDRYGGDQAFEVLIRCCREGGLQAGVRSRQHPTLHQGEVLLWKFRNLKQQKGLLYQALIRQADRYGSHAVPLVEATAANYQRIEILVNRLRLMQFRKKYEDRGLAELFESIWESEKVWIDCVGRALAVAAGE